MPLEATFTIRTLQIKDAMACAKESRYCFDDEAFWPTSRRVGKGGRLSNLEDFFKPGQIARGIARDKSNVLESYAPQFRVIEAGLDGNHMARF